MLTTFRAVTAALALTVIATSAHAQAAALKLAYVNTEALMTAAPGRAAAAAVYDKEAAAFAGLQKKWADSLDKLGTDYSKAEPTLTDAQKKTRLEKIQGIQADLQAKNIEGQQKMQTRQNELLAPLMEAVNKAIEDIRAEDGYAIIFGYGNGSPIVAADKNLDITDRVLNRLKTMAAKAPVAPSGMAPSAVVKKPPTR